MTRRPLARFAALALLALIPAACGGDDGTGPDGVDEGTFQATVTGDISLSIAGQAGFASVNLGGGLTGWSLTMTPADGDGSSLVLTHYGSSPSEGTFALDLNEETGEGYTVGFTYYDGSQYSGSLSATGGSIQITSVSSNSMQGTLTATLEGIINVGGEPQEVTASVTASFSAIGVAF